MRYPHSSRRRRTLTAAAATAVVLVASAYGAAAAATPADDGDDVPIQVVESGPDRHAHGGPSDDERSRSAEEDDDEDAGEEADAPPALDPLGRDCDGSDLAPHEGLQEAPRCVETAFGEVGAADDNPTLLITSAPDEVDAGEPFELEVSTRNLVRDRFLPAAQGGYYLESSFLTGGGLQRGHFHVACRTLASTDAAPAPDPVPAFFKGVEDGGGGAAPDTVTVEVPGLPESGTAQCAAWAGDGSHRIPMMQRANQVPAFDAVRLAVR